MARAKKEWRELELTFFILWIFAFEGDAFRGIENIEIYSYYIKYRY